MQSEPTPILEKSSEERERNLVCTASSCPDGVASSSEVTVKMFPRKNKLLEERFRQRAGRPYTALSQPLQCSLNPTPSVHSDHVQNKDESRCSISSIQESLKDTCMKEGKSISGSSTSARSGQLISEKSMKASRDGNSELQKCEFGERQVTKPSWELGKKSFGVQPYDAVSIPFQKHSQQESLKDRADQPSNDLVSTPAGNKSKYMNSTANEDGRTFALATMAAAAAVTVAMNKTKPGEPPVRGKIKANDEVRADLRNSLRLYPAQVVHTPFHSEHKSLQPQHLKEEKLEVATQTPEGHPKEYSKLSEISNGNEWGVSPP